MKILFVLTLIICFGIGWFLPSNTKTKTNNISPSRAENTARLPVYVNQAKTNNLQSTISAPSEEKDEPELLAIINAFLENFKTIDDDPFKVIYQNYIMLQDLDVATLQKLFIANSKITEKRDTDLVSVLDYFIGARMGELDPLATLAFIKKQTYSSEHLAIYQSVLVSWSYFAIEDMHAWLQDELNNISPETANVGYFLLLRAYAKTDFDFALQYARQLDATYIHSALSGLLESSSLARHYSSLITLAKTSDIANDEVASSDASSLSLMVFRRWAHKSPQDVATWLARNVPLDEYGPIKRDVYVAYAKRDLVDATIWYRNNTPANSKDDPGTQLYGGFAQHINSNQYQKILDWIYTEEDAHLVRIYRGILKEAAVSAPAMAIKHVSDLRNTQQKRQATLDVYQGLVAAANPQAEAFLMSSEFASDKGFLRTANTLKGSAR
jgi:hypothetical protein